MHIVGVSDPGALQESFHVVQFGPNYQSRYQRELQSLGFAFGLQTVGQTSSNYNHIVRHLIEYLRGTLD